MTSEAKKIINWAANQSNGHGAHIDAINYAIESGRVEASVVAELEEAKQAWVNEHNSRVF